MPTDDQSQLLSVATPILPEIVRKEGEDDDAVVFIKGFVSVEVEDRSGDMVPPQEFDVKSFMARPTIMFNHRFWVDERGNQVPIGTPIELFVASIKTSSTDTDVIEVIDDKTREVKNTFPKSKAPNLREGMRGLFGVFRITIPEIVKMVERGEINAFSWRGLVRVGFKVNDDGSTSRILKNIDLFEISVVNVPDNQDSILAIGKAADGSTEYENISGPLTVHMLRMDKDRFESKGMVAEYLKSHGLSIEACRDDDSAYWSKQLPLNAFEETELVSMKLCDGVQVIAGPLKKTSDLPPAMAAERIAGDALENIKEMWVGGSEKEINMSDKKKTKKDVEEATEETKEEETTEETSTEETKEEETKEEVKEEETTEETTEEVVSEGSEAEKAIDDLGASVGKTVAAELKPVFSKLTEALTALTEKVAPSIKESTETPEDKKKDTDTETDNEVAETVEEKEPDNQHDRQVAAKSSKYQAMYGGLLGLTQRLEERVEVAEDAAEKAEAKVDAIAKSVPASLDRTEQIEAEKGADDPNACFDHVWPMT